MSAVRRLAVADWRSQIGSGRKLAVVANWRSQMRLSLNWLNGARTVHLIGVDAGDTILYRLVLVPCVQTKTPAAIRTQTS